MQTRQRPYTLQFEDDGLEKEFQRVLNSMVNSTSSNNVVLTYAVLSLCMIPLLKSWFAAVEAALALALVVFSRCSQWFHQRREYFNLLGKAIILSCNAALLSYYSLTNDPTWTWNYLNYILLAYGYFSMLLLSPFWRTVQIGIPLLAVPATLWIAGAVYHSGLSSKAVVGAIQLLFAALTAGTGAYRQERELRLTFLYKRQLTQPSIDDKGDVDVPFSARIRSFFLVSRDEALNQHCLKKLIPPQLRSTFIVVTGLLASNVLVAGVRLATCSNTAWIRLCINTPLICLDIILSVIVLRRLRNEEGKIAEVTGAPTKRVPIWIVEAKALFSFLLYFVIDYVEFYIETVSPEEMRISGMLTAYTVDFQHDVTAFLILACAGMDVHLRFVTTCVLALVVLGASVTFRLLVLHTPAATTFLLVVFAIMSPLNARYVEALDRAKYSFEYHSRNQQLPA